ncbi:hypothetical protein [Streptomyces sp. NPDC001296]
MAGHSQSVPLDPPARGADVLTLVNEGHLYEAAGQRTRIDDALEPAAAVNRGPLDPAVAGAWAAVESLLSHPDDPRPENERSGKTVAADRMAAITPVPGRAPSSLLSPTGSSLAPRTSRRRTSRAAG